MGITYFFVKRLIAADYLLSTLKWHNARPSSDTYATSRGILIAIKLGLVTATPTTPAMRSNLRRCSDGLEFTCWNGEVIRLAPIIDAFDREMIAWTAVANAGISGSDVRDMMLEAVEKRFAATRTPHAIEHLSDNGSAYTARETVLFTRALNLTPCFTPVASPQSNGMSEAFVKTLKRDYIRISALPDAQTALRLIDGWIEDYNEIHPHSALKMASPRQFIRAKSI